MKKLLILSLLSSMLLGNCIPIFAISISIYFSSTNTINTLTTAQAPLSVMNTLINAGVPLFPEFKQNTAQNDNDNTAVDSNLCLLSYQSKELKTACKFNANMQNYKAEQEAQKRAVVDLYLFYLKLLIEINSVFYLVFLIYLVSLSKSNLPWEIYDLHR